MKNKRKEGPIQKWGRIIDWGKRVKAVCKPCWEIKYCHYGPLVEHFPLKKDKNQNSCRIFGHDCPVFYVSEPLTETKELRNISRSIPRVTQFRVLKRENQICSSCGNSVKDEDIEFDHIIPRIKGGSSDEHNIRLLCRSCNRKKGEKFEDDHLVDSLSERLSMPTMTNIKEFISVFRMLLNFSHDIYREEKRYPTPQDVCRFFGRRKVDKADAGWADITLVGFVEFFKSKKLTNYKDNVFKALKYRFGFSDRSFHSIKEVSRKYRIDTNELIIAEHSLIMRLGWNIKLTDSVKKNWIST